MIAGNGHDYTGTWTMNDIARATGVSVKTVSRVVRGEAGVGESTRSRVSEFIARVGYHPHLGARSMRSRVRDCIGVTIPAPIGEVPLSQQFFTRLFAELYRIFAVKGIYICFDLNPFEMEPADYARGLWEQRFSGCVICGPLKADDKTVARIHQSGSPYVALGRLDSLPECSCATVDYDLATYQSTEYLIRRGHTRIAMLKGFDGYQPGAERLRGYRRALENAGISFDPRLIQNASFGSREISNCVHRLLIEQSVTALIDASGAEDAESVRAGCRRAGRTPGRDLELLCWTYSESAAVMLEACAHMWLPVWEAAMAGLEQLAHWFRGEREGPIQVVFPPTLYETVTKGEIQKPLHLFDLFG